MESNKQFTLGNKGKRVIKFYVKSIIVLILVWEKKLITRGNNLRFAK